MSAPLLLILVLYFAVRLPWIFTVPMVEAPDEFAHYWVINFIHHHLTLPDATDVVTGGPSAVYGSLPPFGYIPHIAVSMLFPEQLIPLGERFGSLISGAIAIWAAFKTGQLLFDKSTLLKYALPLLLVFHPQYVFVNTYANNDSTVSAAASVAIYLLILTLKQGMQLERTMWLALSLAFIALSKYSGWCIFPIVFVAMVVAAWLKNTDTKATIANLFTLVFVPAMITSAFFLHNFVTFTGDFLGTETMYNTWAQTFHRPANFHLSPWYTIKNKIWWQQVFGSFWGMFGYQTRLLPKEIYTAYYWLSLAGVGGLAMAFVKQLKTLKGFNTQLADTQTKDRLVDPAIWTMLSLVIIANIASMIWASSANLGGPQGRYLFPSEIPIMALLLLGMSSFGKASRFLIIAFLSFNILASLYSWWMLFQLFGFRTQLF